MKRIHLFEFEDLPWFPHWLRIRMTRFIVAFHKILGSAEELAELIARALTHTEHKKVIDLCSGSTGPMLEVTRILREKHGYTDLDMTLSDLYPHEEAVAEIEALGDPNLRYLSEPVDAADVDAGKKGVRTLVCSMHHMKPEVAPNILADAQEDNAPIVIFEISDNSFPRWLWWTAIPINYLMTFFVTPLIRPMTWQQIVFTYFIPLLPFFIAWDGAVSNARTYTLEDWDQVLELLPKTDYTWEKGVIKGKAKKSYLLGLPAKPIS